MHIPTRAATVSLFFALLTMTAGCSDDKADSEARSTTTTTTVPTTVSTTRPKATTTRPTTIPPTTSTIAPTTTKAPTPATTSPPPADVRAVDLQALTYVLDCPSGPGVAISPRGGAAGGADAAIDRFQVVGYGDLNGDGSEDAVVSSTCVFASGGNAFTTNVAVVVVGPSGPRQLGPPVDGFEPRVEGSTLVVKRSQHLPDDPRCCPSIMTEARLHWSGSAWVTAPPPTTAPPTRAPSFSPGEACPLGSDRDCIDPDGDGQGTYLRYGGDCVARWAEFDDIGLCNDLDGDGVAGYPDSG